MSHAATHPQPTLPDHAQHSWPPERAPQAIAIQQAVLDATRAAALAALPHAGQRKPLAADAAATTAMRSALASMPARGIVVTGEGEKDGAPMLYNGENVGTGRGPRLQLAVDPLEGTKLCAAGAPGAICAIGACTQGEMWSPGPAFYMDKLIVGARAAGTIDITAPPEANLRSVAAALSTPLSELRVTILDKPRHRDLIARAKALSVKLSTPPDGDLAASLQALLPNGACDVVMGIGGTPEGVIGACATVALEGQMQCRLAPQKEAERQRLRETRADLSEILTAEQITGPDAFFAATGVTGGALLCAPRSQGRLISTESLLITSSEIWFIQHTTPQSTSAGAPMRSGADA